MAFNWPPRNYACCDGAEVVISANQALYSLLGNQFGGSYPNTFKLPDLRGRTPVGIDYDSIGYNNQGTQGGLEAVVLSVQEMPAHTHGLMAMPTDGEYPLPAVITQTEDGKVFARSVLASDHSSVSIYAEDDNMSALSVATSSTVGGNQGHSNLQPSLVINFVIALAGLYPQRW